MKYEIGNIYALNVSPSDYISGGLRGVDRSYNKMDISDVLNVKSGKKLRNLHFRQAYRKFLRIHISISLIMNFKKYIHFRKLIIHHIIL